MFACIYVPDFSAAHTSLLEFAYSFSPRVEQTAADTVVLDLDGLESLFGTPQKIANRMLRHARSLGLEANVAVAANPDAAIHAARGFSGVTVIPPGREAERLSTLPLDLLRPSAEMLETFDRWGLRTFADLARLPEIAVSERLGQEGVRLHKLARGTGSRSLVPAQSAGRFEEVTELEHPFSLLEPLAFVLGRMLDQIFARLSERALGTNEVCLRLELEPSPGAFIRRGLRPLPTRHPLPKGEGINGRPLYERTLHLPLPVQNPKLLLKLLQLDLRAHPPGAPILKVAVAVKPVKPRTIQNGLFVPLSPEPEKLDLTLARIAGIVGENNVGSPEILDTHRPDAFRMRRFGVVPSPESRVPSHNPRPATMALRMFRPPLPATIEADSGKPARVVFSGVSGRVVSATGPWRTSGDWWRADAWTRDEWDVVLSTSAGTLVCRIFRDLAAEGWFVEGVYD